MRVNASADEAALERRALIWMCVLIAVNQFGFGGIVPVLPLYARSFDVSHSSIGMAIAVYGLARFVTAVPAGQLADRLGRRGTLAVGGAISCIGNVWCALATSYPEFVVARFVSGAGAGVVLTIGVVVLADISTPARRGRVMAIYQGAFLFAVGIGPFPGGWLAETFGLAAPFASYAVAGALASAVAWLAVPETRDLPGALRGSAPGGRLPFTRQLGMLFAQIGFVLVCAIALMNAVARTGGLFNIIPVIGKDQLALSATEIGFGLALGSIMGLAATYPAGALVDRYGRKAVIVPATFMTALSFFLFVYAPGYAWFVAASVTWGVASAVGGAAPSAYAADSAPPGMNAAAMSTFRMLGDVGYVIGPIGLGLVVDLFGAQTALVVAAALLVVVGACFGLFAPETHARMRARAD